MANLLHELFLCMNNDTTDNPHMKYIPIGTVNIIGPKLYKNLICANNAYLLLLATIPVVRISDETLSLCISVHHPDKLETKVPINTSYSPTNGV